MTAYKKYHPVSAMESPRYSGIRTFMRLPHITEISQDVDIAIVGVPFDTGGTYRVGARCSSAPTTQRWMWSSLNIALASIMAICNLRQAICPNHIR